MGFFGDLFSKTPVPQTTFTNNQTTVNEFLEEVCQTVSINMSSNTQINNTANIGDRKIVASVGKNGSVDVGSNITQTAEAKAVQTLSAVINEILKSAESSDIKLDAIGTVSQTAESSKFLSGSKSGNVDITNNAYTNNVSESVKNIQTFLNALSQAEIKNEVNIGNLDLTVKVEQNGDFNLVDNVTQHATYYNDQLIDLVNNSETCRNLGVTQDIITDIIANQENKETGVIENVGGMFSGIWSGILSPIVAIVVAIVVLIIIVYIFKVIKAKHDSSLEGGIYNPIDEGRIYNPIDPYLLM